MPYRLSGGGFWWFGGVAFLLGSRRHLPPVAIAMFVLAMASGFYFWIRIGIRGIGHATAWLYIVRPAVGFPFLGWLWFGSPFGNRWERAVFYVNIAGLALSLATYFFLFAQTS
jgi:hypothetical protein